MHAQLLIYCSCLLLQKLGWKVELLSSTTQESGGFKEVICQVGIGGLHNEGLDYIYFNGKCLHL